MRKEISSIIYIMRAVVLALSLLLLATCDVGLGSTIDTTAPSLTTDGTYIIASDGSDTLYFMDKNYSVKKTLSVKQDGLT